MLMFRLTCGTIFLETGTDFYDRLTAVELTIGEDLFLTILTTRLSKRNSEKRMSIITSDGVLLTVLCRLLEEMSAVRSMFYTRSSPIFPCPCYDFNKGKKLGLMNTSADFGNGCS